MQCWQGRFESSCRRVRENESVFTVGPNSQLDCNNISNNFAVAKNSQALQARFAIKVS
jgi:hypothetical protein